MNKLTMNKAAFAVVVALRNDCEVNLYIDDRHFDAVHLVQRAGYRATATTSEGELYTFPNKEALSNWLKDYYFEKGFIVEYLLVNGEMVFFDTLEEFILTVKEFREKGILK